MCNDYSCISKLVHDHRKLISTSNTLSRLSCTAENQFGSEQSRLYQIDSSDGNLFSLNFLIRISSFSQMSPWLWSRWSWVHSFWLFSSRLWRSIVVVERDRFANDTNVRRKRNFRWSSTSITRSMNWSKKSDRWERVTHHRPAPIEYRWKSNRQVSRRSKTIRFSIAYPFRSLVDKLVQ